LKAGHSEYRSTHSYICNQRRYALGRSFRNSRSLYWLSHRSVPGTPLLTGDPVKAPTNMVEKEHQGPFVRHRPHLPLRFVTLDRSKPDFASVGKPRYRGK
jgi:hypothetical protein